MRLVVCFLRAVIDLHVLAPELQMEYLGEAWTVSTYHVQPMIESLRPPDLNSEALNFLPK